VTVTSCCVNGHRYTPDNTYTAPGRTDRQCRRCRRGAPEFDIWVARRTAYADSLALRILYRAYGYHPKTVSRVGVWL
jgi:hypothetical protein